MSLNRGEYMSIHRVNIDLYTGWSWIYIQVKNEYVEDELNLIYGVNASLYAGWIQFYTQGVHESIYMMIMNLYTE